MNELVEVLLFSTLSFVTLFIISKLLGKKQIAELDFIDYVVGISIGSIAAEMATETQTPFYYYLIAMGIFFLLDFIVSILGSKTNGMKAFFKGRPLVLIENGEIKYENLKKSKVDLNDLTGLCRSKNYFDLNDVAFAILETNGELSVLPKAEQKPVVVSDIKIKAEKPSLTPYIIVDGAFSRFGLVQAKLTREEVRERLGLKKRSELKKILLAEYDSKKDDIIVTYKKND